jgi:hypothetical protein
MRETPMPKFVIERQYLLPIYQRLIIDVPDIATACQKAVENDDWESAEEDGDGSGATTINAAQEIREGLIEQVERGEIHAGSSFGKTSPDTDRTSTSPKYINDPSPDRAPSDAIDIETWPAWTTPEIKELPANHGDRWILDTCED